MRKIFRNFLCSINIQQMTTEKVPKVPSIYNCKTCNYETSRSSQYQRHLLTSKHVKNSEILQNTTNLVQKVPGFICNICNNMYKHHSSLYNHKKKCNKKDLLDDIKKDTDNKDDLINYLIKENQEFKNLSKEVVIDK